MACDRARAGLRLEGGLVTLRGHIDSIVNDVLTGWYYAEDGSREFRVFADGEFVGAGVAATFRKDLLSAGIGDGAHGFEFVLPVGVCDGGEHRFEIVHQTTDARIPERAFRTGTGASIVVGRLERVLDGMAIGWVWDRRDPNARLEVSAFEQDRLLGSAKADLPREDLAQAGFGDGRHAFVLDLPRELFQRSEPVELKFRVDEAHGDGVFAVARLDALSAPESADGSIRYSGLTAASRAGLAPISELLFLQAEVSADLDDVDLTFGAAGAGVTTRGPTGNVRLLHLFPAVGELLRDEWTIEIEFETRTAFTFSAALFEFDHDDTFRPILTLAEETTAAPGPHRIGHWISSRRARQERLDLRERPIFLALESRSALCLAELRIHIERRKTPAETIPFRASEHPHLSQLADLNDKFSGPGKRDPDAWALDAAEAALRLECFETASGLIERIDFTRHTPKFQLRYLRVFIEVAFAEGRLDDVRIRLLENWPLAKTDDRLFAALSACFPATAELRGFFAKLPSGRPNLAWLMRHPMNSEALAASLGDAFDNGEGSLVWANLARSFGARDYLAAWNRYLRRFELEGLASIDLSRPNVLSTMTFEPSPSYTEGPLVSVLMSAYNAGETVLYAAESILRQTHANVELLICDDRSSDDTASKLASLRERSRVRLFQSRGNQGPYNIRNNLQREARGSFVTFQDADDVAHPSRIARQLAEVQRTGRPFALARWIRLRPDGEIVFFRDQISLRLCLVSLFAEKGAIERLGGFRSVLCGADSEFAQRLRAPGAQKIYSEMSEPLILGLWSQQSLTRQDGLEATEDGLRSKVRRIYAENAGRRHALGDEIVSNEAVDEGNRRLGIYRVDCGIAPLDA